MKLFAFILSLYITVLSIVPCTDGIPQNRNHSDIAVSTAEHNHNHPSNQDSCTPFCVCSCCGTVVTLPTMQSFVVTNVVVSTDYFFHYSFNYSFDFSKGTWHPPAIS